MEKENVFFLGLLWVLLNFLLRVRNMFNLIFTGVAPLISYFALKFKFILSIQFFLYNSFYFQCLLSQNTVNVNFHCLPSQITVPMVFSSFNSINGFKITTWTAIKLIWYQITLMAFTPLRKDLKWYNTSKIRYYLYVREFYSFKKPTLLNLMRQVAEMNLMEPFFSPMNRLIPAEF